MANIIKGAVFTKVKSGENWTIIEISEDTKKATLAKDGSEEISISVSSLKDKRQWVEKEKIELSEAEVEYVKNDEVEVLTAFGKVKKVRVPKKASDSEPVTGIGSDIRDYIITRATAMGNVVLTDSGRFTSLKTGNRMFAAIFSYSKKSLTLGVRSIAVKDLGYEPTSKANHMMDYRFKMTTLDSGIKKMIEDLLDASAKYQANKNNKSKEVH